MISSDHALTLDRMPGSAVILGGGVIGVEFASVWRSFGAEVTIVEMLPHLLPTEEESSSRQLERSFRRRGIGFELGTKFEGVKDTAAASPCRWRAARRWTPSCCWSRWAAGRSRPALATRKPAYHERGFVVVDGYGRTSVPTISAVGDLIPGPQLAHAGFAEGILVAEQVGGLNVTPIDYDGVPRITYSHPEVASVGITSAVAAERGIETVELNYPVGGNGKSVILQTQGAAKVIATAPAESGGQPGPVLGIHLVGARVGELIAEGQLIYNWEAVPADVAQLIHPHPTQSEMIGEAHLALAGKPLHFHS